MKQCCILDTGYWDIQGVYWKLDTGDILGVYWILDTGDIQGVYWILDTEICRVHTGYWILGYTGCILDILDTGIYRVYTGYWI